MDITLPLLDGNYLGQFGMKEIDGSLIAKQLQEYYHQDKEGLVIEIFKGLQRISLVDCSHSTYGIVSFQLLLFLFISVDDLRTAMPYLGSLLSIVHSTVSL